MEKWVQPASLLFRKHHCKAGTIKDLSHYRVEKAMRSGIEIIRDNQTEFIFASNEVGIDGARLLSNLPPAGTLLKGNKVPVLTQKYRGTCSVLLYMNRTRAGQEYPFVQFRTFKHGGLLSEFNGYKHLNVDSTISAAAKSIKQSSLTTVNINEALASTRLQEDQVKLQRYHSVQRQYFAAKPIGIDHPWLTRRLHGHATPKLLARTDIRTTLNGDLFAPLQSQEFGNVGYHKIFSKNEQDHKRHLIMRSGRLNGSFIEIRGLNSSRKCIAICEGLITGLTIALIWEGPIYVALTANNLLNVRHSVSLHSREPVYLFADNDQWKPHVGNVGVCKARAAMLTGDHIVIPQFSPQSQLSKPTDFNDVLRYEGLMKLERQLPLAR